VNTKPASTQPPSRSWRSRLTFHLAIVLIAKVILLTLLWHAFIKPNKVKVDIDAMSSRIATPTPSVSQARPSITPGDNK